MKKLYLLLFLLLVCITLFGQNVQIQGNATITGTVEIMDTILFADGTELASACLQILQDTDGDTKIEVEKNPDEDIIRFSSEGVEIAIFDKNRMRLMHKGNSIYIGNAGGSDIGNNGNIAIGNGAAGNIVFGMDNIHIGTEAGSEEDGSQNVLIGSQSGFGTFGNENTYVGYKSGESQSGFRNTVIGSLAGSNSSGDGNIFVGHEAGKSLTGGNKLVIDNTDSPSPFLYGDLSGNRLVLNGTQNLGASNFTIHDLDGSWGGMYLNTNAIGGKPFYGYALGGSVKGYHYMDDSNYWRFVKGSTALVLDENNFFGVGEENPETKLHVKASNSSGHVMKIENTSTNAAADGLEIKINRSVTGLENNYITFNDANSATGRIEGFALGEGPNFTDFPGINIDLYYDVASIIANSFDPGYVPYYDLNTLVLPPFNEGNLGQPEGNFIMYPQNFVDNVLCLGNLFCTAADMKTVGFVNVSNPTAQLPGLDWNQFMWPELVPGVEPTLDLSILLDPVVQANAFTDMTAIANWALENGVEALSADPFHIKLMNDPNYWFNMATFKHGGVTYGSRGADYAEWLERDDPSKDIKAGQIVGVKNGKISLNTTDADQIMAISVMPVVLGNMPDTTKQEDFEKVAFIGQTPVWVVGEVESGDYIIASGQNDGYGLAVAEEDITIEQVSQVVGRAWEDGDKLINLVNIAVGLKTNEMAAILSRTAKKVEEMDERLAKIEAMLSSDALASKE